MLTKIINIILYYLILSYRKSALLVLKLRKVYVGFKMFQHRYLLQIGKPRKLNTNEYFYIELLFSSTF